MNRPVRPLLRTPLGLTAAGLLALGVVLTLAGGGGAHWFTLDGEPVYRTSYRALGLSLDDGTFKPMANAFVQIYPAALFFSALVVALAGWAQRRVTRIVAAVALFVMAGACVAQARSAVGPGDALSASDATVAIGTGLVLAAVLAGMAPMLFRSPQWLLCAAGGLLVIVMAVGLVVGLAQVLAASDASLTVQPLLSVFTFVAIGASLLMLAQACVTADRLARPDGTVPAES